MGQPTTKAEILKAIELQYRNLQTYQNHVVEWQRKVANANMSKNDNASYKAYCKGGLASAKGNVARCKAEIAALKVRLKQAKK